MVLMWKGLKAPGETLWTGADVYLHRTVNLVAVEHEVEEVQVVNGRLPGHICSFILQVLCSSEGQHGADDLCSSFLKEGDDKNRPSVSKPAALGEDLKNLTGFSGATGAQSIPAALT